ncbi:MAG: RNA polymerase sigma factor [Hyphomicrobiales bacterium]
MEASEILQGILESNRKVLNYIYKNHYKSIKSHICQNNGTEDDAKDIFQEGVMIIYQKIKEKSLVELSCTFHTYLFSVCKYLWLQQLNKKGIKVESDSKHLQECLSIEPDLTIFFDETSKFDLYRKHFLTLSNECQKVLNLFLQKTPQKNIAKIMGFKSVDYAKRKKYLCKEKLVEKIKSDPKYKEIAL